LTELELARSLEHRIGQAKGLKYMTVPVDWMVQVITKLNEMADYKARRVECSLAGTAVDLKVVSKGYDWTLAIDDETPSYGCEVHALTAGDMGYEPTGIFIRVKDVMVTADYQKDKENGRL
jgi:hypothetical protein